MKNKFIEIRPLLILLASAVVVFSYSLAYADLTAEQVRWQETFDSCYRSQLYEVHNSSVNAEKICKEKAGLVPTSKALTYVDRNKAIDECRQACKDTRLSLEDGLADERRKIFNTSYPYKGSLVEKADQEAVKCDLGCYQIPAKPDNAKSNSNACKDGFEKLSDGSCAAVCSAEKHLARKSKTECSCAQLYSMDSEKQCVLSLEKKLTFDSDTRDKMEGAVEKLGPNESSFIEGKLANGKSFRVGILRLSDGKFLFTSDGKHYYDSPDMAIRPGFKTRVSEKWDNFKKGLRGLWSNSTERGTAGDKAAQEDAEERLDAAGQALTTLQGDLDPSKQADTATKALLQFKKRAGKLADEKYDDLILGEVKNATGVDVKQIKKILKGDVAGLATDVVDQVKAAAYGFPAQSVVIMAKDLNVDRFKNALTLYAGERQGGKTPDQIFGENEAGALPELDLVTSITGPIQQFAKESAFSAYEEGYQRYLLLQQFNKKQ